jgi:hypothetical protein
MKYVITVGCTVEAYAREEVEAVSPEEACRLALQRHDDGDWPPLEPNWDCAGDDRIVHIQDDAGDDLEIPGEFF